MANVNFKVKNGLQVTGGAYISGNLGVGITVAGEKLDVNGNAYIRGYLSLPQNPVNVGYGTTTSNPPYFISQLIGDSDYWRVYGESPSGTNTGSLVIEVNDDVDGSEKIVFRNRRNYGTVLGISTFMEMTNSANIMQTVPLLIGAATSTGTASQPLQVTGGTYISGSLGIGNTIPTSRLDVVGDAKISGIATITTLTNTTLRNYGETVNVVGNTGTAATINLANGNFVTATLTGNCTFTFTTGLSSGAISFTLVLTNDGTAGRSIVWPAAVKWPNGTTPVRTTAANKTDVYTFFTSDNGTNWFGNLSLYNYS